MNTRISDVEGISAIDLKAIRNADRVSFHWHGNGYHIHAHKERENTRDGYEQTIRILVNGSVSQWSDGQWGKTDNNIAAAFAWLPTPSQSLNWKTTIAAIKPGDVLTLRFHAGANSQNLTDAGLYRDFLDLEAQRGDKTFSWRIDESVCPDNSARMCRRFD